ncbi:MAG: asparagine synthase-related protein [Candidatus Omnitrophota bacterium]|jgi:asparagine synthase (glutamine-hydrolysing)
MNYIYGKVNWAKADVGQEIRECNHFRNTWIDLYINRIVALKHGKNPFFYNEKTDILCALIGYISNLSKIKKQIKIDLCDDVAVVEELYRLEGIKFIDKLDGIFTVIIFDNKLRKGLCFQDNHGSNLPLYYLNNEDGFAFSTSLKLLLNNSKFIRELDYTSIFAFLSNGNTVPGESTLIKHVKKLVPNTFISFEVERSACNVCKCQPLIEQPSLSDAKENLIASIQDNARILCSALVQKTRFLALSSGYDSNFILHTLKDSGADKICAVTIGGQKENEIPQVKEILKFYSTVDSAVHIISPALIQALPDILWRLEGYVFEKGIFLQYALGKVLCEKNALAVFLGECADQILDQNRISIFDRLKEKIKLLVQLSIIGDVYYLIKKKNEPIHRKVIARVRPNVKATYDTNFDFILKKNGIMLNSFGTQGLYVYINKTTQAISKKLGKLNSKKMFFKKSVERLVLPRVAGVFAHRKHGGSTDTEYLMFEDLKSVLAIIQTTFIEKIVGKAYVRTICKKPEAYSEPILQLVYLYLFNELFVSGKYDSRLCRESLEVPLADFVPQPEDRVFNATRAV